MKWSASKGKMKLVTLMVMIAMLILIWVFSPLREILEPRQVVLIVHDIPSDGFSFSLFLVAFAIGTCFFIPVAALTLASAIVFPLGPSLLCSLLGAALASASGYLLGRMFSVKDIPKLYGERTKRVLDQLEKNGAWAVLALRIAPTPPFTLTSLIAGSLKLPLLPYLMGSITGIAPLIIMVTLFGRQILDLLEQPSLIAASSLVAVVIIFLIYHFNKKRLLAESLKTEKKMISH